MILKAGDQAPLFSSKDQDGKPVELSKFKGKKVVLYFYPEDDTPTCTVEACNLRDNYSVLTEKGIIVLGVSPDDEKKHKKFATKYNLPFSLLADEKKVIIDLYGVWGEKNLYGRKYMGIKRTTFLIDEKGLISKIFQKPKSKIHSEEIINAFSLLS